MPGSDQDGNLKWVITTLIAIFAGAGADRIIVEARLSAMQEEIKGLVSVEQEQNRRTEYLSRELQRIDTNQVQNRQIIDQLVKDVEWLRKH